MRPTIEELRRQRAPILAAAERWGAHHLRVFGSVARGTPSDGSDLDVVVAFERDRSLLDLGGLKADLEEMLGCPVDVLSEGGLHDEFKAAVLRDAIDL